VEAPVSRICASFVVGLWPVSVAAQDTPFGQTAGHDHEKCHELSRSPLTKLNGAVMITRSEIA
jgi:hypothetical protein